MPYLGLTASEEMSILVPRGRAPFGQHQESQPLACSHSFLSLIGQMRTQ